jgi:hypothetical protein
MNGEDVMLVVVIVMFAFAMYYGLKIDLNNFMFYNGYK